MDAMKVLGETNLKISEAKNILTKLQSTEAEYIQKREAKALEQIQKNLKDSKDIIDKTNSNYLKVKELNESVCSIVDYLDGVLSALNKTIETFDTVSSKFYDDVKSQKLEIENIEKALKLDVFQIQSEKKNIDRREKVLTDMKKHIESREESLKKSYKINQNLWEKITQLKN